jgi:hypothetical protein
LRGGGVFLYALSSVSVQAARKPNFVLDDHSSRPCLATWLKQPTRRFRLVLAHISSPGRDGPSRARRLKRNGETPCLFGLAPCGVYHAATVTSRAVGSYPAVSPLPSSILAEGRLAVCFLLHWPSSGLALAVPDVIRHTALGSSDFPPPPDCLRSRRQRSSGRLHRLSIAAERQSVGKSVRGEDRV